MKKLIIVLMVVAVASFLFVGCIPTVPDVDVDEEEPTPTPTPPVTEAPIITSIKGAGGVAYSLTSTATQYINIADASFGVKVIGVGFPGAIIRIYVNDVYAGTGTTGLGGIFTVTLSADNLGTTDGSKVITAKATQSGLAESVASTAYTFTQDTARPTITSVVGDASADYITVTFSESVKASTVVDATWKYGVHLSVYVSTSHLVVLISTPSSTTARLGEVNVPAANLVIGQFLSVKSETLAVEDSAGNGMVIPVTVYGFVY